jgi:hypothetical protein
MTKRAENLKKSTEFSFTLTLVSMVLGAALSRLIPHPWNFTAIGAMALFGGAYFQSRISSMLVPMAALFLSDLILGFHSTMLFVYVPFALTVVLGWTLQENKKPARIVPLSLLTSLVFFLVSNFGVWVMGGFYSSSWHGLVDCYVAAIPFFDNQIFGDLFFTGLLFGSFELLRKGAPNAKVPVAIKNGSSSTNS